MTSINGIDPIVVDTIKIQTQKPAVIETQKVKINQDKRDREKNKKNSRENQGHTQHSLIVAVEKLNKLLDKNKIPLYFQIYDENSGTMIMLVNAITQDLITKVTPEKIFKLVAEFTTRGFTIDERI